MRMTSKLFSVEGHVGLPHIGLLQGANRLVDVDDIAIRDGGCDGYCHCICILVCGLRDCLEHHAWLGNFCSCSQTSSPASLRKQTSESRNTKGDHEVVRGSLSEEVQLAIFPQPQLLLLAVPNAA